LAFPDSGLGRKLALLFRRDHARPLQRPDAGFCLGGWPASDALAGRLDDRRFLGFRRGHGGFSIFRPGKDLFRNEKRGRAFRLIREDLVRIFDVKNDLEQTDMEGS